MKLGLSFPETDFTDNENVLKPTNTANLLTNTTHMPSSVNGGVSNGVVKHNSQLLPKRHGVPVARSGSQKNVDFKSIFNNMNINSTSNTNATAAANINRYGSNVSRESDRTNIYSNSPSPDFLANAMTPAKNTANLLNINNGNAQLHASASTQRGSRQTNYNDGSNRKLNSTASNYNDANIPRNQNSASSSATTRNGEYKTDRYYAPVSTNNTSNTHLNNNNNNNRISNVSDEYQAQAAYYQSLENNRNSTGNKASTVVTTAAMRNVYRGSPERSLPRSPERQIELTNNNYRPTSRISSSRPVVSEMQYTTTVDKNYDAPKFKVINYLAGKRSLTSCDEITPNYDSKQKGSSNNVSSVVKNRQLQMGKAKIDLETQNSESRKMF